MTPAEDAGIAPRVRGDTGMPETIEEADPLDDAEGAGRSLLADVEALIDDGKTYLEAELAYQRTRAAFVADGAKSAVILFAMAVLLAFLALIGLTVGLIIALTPILTAWGASALVVALLLVGAVIAGRAAAGRWGRLMAAIEGKPGNEP